MLHIYIDADACPVKSETYKVAKRYGLQVTLVSNTWMRTPRENWLTLEVVGNEPDEADDWIAENVASNDIVITADIPLASRCIKKNAFVINNKGKLLTDDNIGGVLATRDLMTDLRGIGEQTGGPPPMTQRDRSNFLQSLDNVIQKIKRKSK